TAAVAPLRPVRTLVLLVLFCFLVVVFLVLSRPGRVALVEVVVLGAVPSRIPDAQFRPQTLKIRRTAAVLQLAGAPSLLGLGPAAPHWLDPLNDGALSAPGLDT